MKKIWGKYYLLLGTILMVTLSAICSVAFVKSNVRQIQDKMSFESIYTDTSIDFIVPGPSYTQVKELENDKDNGIAAVTPYYETSVGLRINDNNAFGTTIIMPSSDKLQYTPYGASRIISGDKNVTVGDAIADKVFAANNNIKIGDTAVLDISDEEYPFTVRSIAESNTYYNNGTIAVVLTDEQNEQLQANGVKYSAAYVSASNYEVCKTYLYNEYKPYSRLKDAADFENEDAYNQHLQNFENADWTKEITNCRDNYAGLSVKYENVGSGVCRNIVMAALLTLLAVIIFNLVLLRLDKLKIMFQGFLVKKSGTIKEIKSFYRKGILFNAAVFCAATLGFYVWIVAATKIRFISGGLTSLIMVIAQIMGSLFMCGLSTSYIEKNYIVKSEVQESTSEEKTKKTMPQDHLANASVNEEGHQRIPQKEIGEISTKEAVKDAASKESSEVWDTSDQKQEGNNEQ